MLKSWIFLYVAIFSEVCGTMCLKAADGFSRLLPSAGVVLFYAVSFFCMSRAMRQIDVGVAYAIWSAVGIVSIAFISAMLFGESVTFAKGIAYTMIIGGVLILNLTTS